MRLILTLLTLLSVQVSATDTVTCQSCHPTIYHEFQQSFHKKSSINEDVVHKAVWDKHPAKAKGEYKCAKCHTPQNQKHEGITCLTCHTITDIKLHPKSNENIYEKKEKTLYSAEKGMEHQKVVYQEKSSWFGLLTKTTGSPYHDIDYRNKNYYTGKVCMGCHSHKQNGKGFELCKVEMPENNSSKPNCITCHMPKVQGSATTIRESQTHAFHGFAGARNAHEMLSQYVDINHTILEDGFEIHINNNSPHPLFTHPLRVVKLKTTLKREGQLEELQTHTFVKVIGTNNKPSMPWLATEVLKDTMIQAQESRGIHFDKKLQAGDEVEVTLGYYIVNPKVAPKLGLEKEKALSQFTALKHAYFKVK